MKNNSSKYYLLLFIIGLALIAYAIVPLLLAKHTNRIPGFGINIQKNTVGTVINSAFTPKGTLTLSLVPKNSLNKTLEGFAFDLEKNTLQTATKRAHISYSPNQKHSTSIVGATVYKNGSPIATTTLSGVRLPSINNHGDILFSALVKSDAHAGGKLTLDEWRIFSIEHGTSTVHKLINGQYPKWIDASRFVYASKDGIYTYNTKNNTKKILIPFNGYNGANNMKLNTSDDGSLLAWSMPDTGNIIIYDTHTGKKIHTFAVTGFWTAFSPDNAYIAIQAIDPKNPIKNPKPRIEIYSLSDYTLQYTIDLDSFIQTAMFLNDWIY